MFTNVLTNQYNWNNSTRVNTYCCLFYLIYDNIFFVRHVFLHFPMALLSKSTALTQLRNSISKTDYSLRCHRFVLALTWSSVELLLIRNLQGEEQSIFIAKHFSDSTVSRKIKWITHISINLKNSLLNTSKTKAMLSWFRYECMLYILNVQTYSRVVHKQKFISFFSWITSRLNSTLRCPCWGKNLALNFFNIDVFNVYAELSMYSWVLLHLLNEQEPGTFTMFYMLIYSLTV